MLLVLPYRGEFGHKIMWHVPTVHALKEEKVICCEPGEEALFPNALEHVIVDRGDDLVRREIMRHDKDFYADLLVKLAPKYPNFKPIFPHRGTSEFFIPKPITNYNISCDVVICPRKRRYGSIKNWKHWNELSQELIKKYKVFAGGAPDSSFELDNIDCAWKYERYLDATICALLSCKFVIATDNGLAFLALLCGKPLVLISHHDGKTAPGYLKINMNRYNNINFRNVHIETIHNSWTDIKPILDYITK